MNGLCVLVGVVVVLVLVGCMIVGFDYQLLVDVVVYKVVVGVSFKEGVKSVVFSFDLLLFCWWCFYQSFELDGLVEQVLVVNILLCVVEVYLCCVVVGVMQVDVECGLYVGVVVVVKCVCELGEVYLLFE